MNVVRVGQASLNFATPCGAGAAVSIWMRFSPRSPFSHFTNEIAQLTARIDAEARRAGTVIPFADLQIGVTALYFGFAIATLDVHHFNMIPGLILHRLLAPS